MARFTAVVLALALVSWPPAAVHVSTATDNAWLIVVDDLHLPFANTGRLRDLLRKIAAELIDEGDRYVFRATGPSAASLTTSALTDDRERAASAIKFMTGNGLKESDILVAGWSTSPMNEVLYRANTALDAAEDAMFALTTDAAPRQAIVYVSSGYDIETLPAIAERLTAHAHRARENNITIFAIDGPGMQSLENPNSGDAWSRYLSATRRSLETMTGQAGGFVIDRPNEPGPGLKRISAQMRN